MSSLNPPRSAAIALAIALAGGCTFDDTGLDDKDRCATGSDCLSGYCLEGRCLSGPDRGAPPTGDQDAGPDADAQRTGPCGGAEPNACGGCEKLPAQPGDNCDDGCGTYRCGQGGDSLDCQTVPPNPCGGCSDLGATPGDPCGTCAVWTCDPDQDALTCQEEPLNACGGCNQLSDEPGTECGECRGAYECDGTDLVQCIGGEPNPCGGCGGAQDATIGAECACEGLGHRQPATWRCVEDSTIPLCDDDNDSAIDAIDLGELRDTDTTPRIAQDALQFPGDLDWFVVEATDQDSILDPLVPEVQASDLPASYDVCAIWQYDDRRSWPLLCVGGSEPFLIDGVPGCCAAGTGATRTIRILRDVAFNERLDDAFRPGHADGSLFIVVFSETDGFACEEYTLHVRF